MLYKVEIPLFLHSDGAAETLSATAGSFDKFRVGFNPPLKVPRNAIQPTIALIGFDSFYTYPNLTSAAQLRFTATGSGTFGAVSGVAQTVSFPKGLYSVAAIQGILSDYLVASTLSDTLLTISGNDATQKVTFVASGLAAGDTLVIDAGNTSDELLVLLGFTQSADGAAVTSVATMTGVAGTTSQLVEAPFVANFGDSLSHVNVHTSLSSGGIGISGTSTDVVGAIVPNTGVGGQITYQAPFPLHCSCEHLRGSTTTSATFYITNQNNVPLDTNGDHWSLQLLLSWAEKHEE